MRRLFISADIEGCAAVCSEHAQMPDAWEWGKAREWMTNEVLASCVAALENGYDEIIVADGHGNALNLLPDLMPKHVKLIRSWPRPLLQMQGIETESVDGCIFIGYHTGANDDRGVLAHTYFGGAFRNIKLNGTIASEGYLNAALAGQYNVPVIMVSGDSDTIEDAKRYSPEAEGCVVKTAIGRRSQMSISPAEANEMIEEATLRAIQKVGSIDPFSVPGPFEIEIEFTSHLASDVLSYLDHVERIGSRTIKTQLSTIDEAMRFISFLIFYNPTGKMIL